MGRRPSGEAEAEWRGRLEAWDASGLTLRAYALREGLNPYTAWRWKRRLRGTTAFAASFAPVVVERASAEGGAFELVTASGLSLRIPSDFDETALARLIALLGRS